MSEFYAYIDESGDEGVGKGSKWFILAALITDQKQSSDLGQVYNRIIKRIELHAGKPLHWAELSHARKKAVIEELATHQFTFCSIAVDTQHPEIVNSKPRLQGRKLYYYSFSLLVERITWYCNESGARVRLYPENKAGIKYDELRGFLEYIQNQPDSQIVKECLLGVQPMAKSQSNILQIADCICGALHNALDYRYGVNEESYLLPIVGKLYKHNGKAVGYGLKFYPHKTQEIAGSLEEKYRWLKTI